MSDNCLDVKNELLNSKCVTNGTHKVTSTPFATRFIYNSHVNPAMVEAAFARQKKLTQKMSSKVTSGTFWADTSSDDKNFSNSQSVSVLNTCSEVKQKCGTQTAGHDGQKLTRDYTGDSGGVVCAVKHHLHESTPDSPQKSHCSLADTLSDTGKRGHSGLQNAQDEVPISVNDETDVPNIKHCTKPIYDVNYCQFEDKFATEIICANAKYRNKDWGNIQTPIFNLWCDQVDFTFGFVPLQEQVMPTENIPDGVACGHLNASNVFGHHDKYC